MLRKLFITWSLAFPTWVSASPGLPVADYDENLCITAQRLLVNDPAIPVRVQRAVGNGFHSIQMSVDDGVGELVVAMTWGVADIDGATLRTHVACKMVSRERANDQLALELSGPRRSCQDINAHSWMVAWRSLSDVERQRYARAGRPVYFADDAVLASGGEWLPAAFEDYVDTTKHAMIVRAPTVRVPWNGQEREFYQGTQHCKLITLAALQRWMRVDAFAEDGSIFATHESACRQPHALTSKVGSCLFYFAPVDGFFCQDYSGSAWTAAAAQAECSKRHASKQALRDAKNRYEGSGGIYRSAACDQRDDVPAITGTCVFHCQAADETLWHINGPVGGPVNKACSLFIDREP